MTTDISRRNPTKQQHRRARQYMRNCHRKARKAWKDVKDPNKWLEELRGY